MPDQIHNLDKALKISNLNKELDQIIEEQKQTLQGLQVIEAKHAELVSTNAALQKECDLLKTQIAKPVHIAENIKSLEAVKATIKEEITSSNLDKTIQGIIDELVKMIDRNVELVFSMGELAGGRYQSVPDEIKKAMHDATPFMKERFLIYFMELGRMDVLNFYKHFPQYDPNKQ